MTSRICVKFDLTLTLRLTRREAAQAFSDDFKERLRLALDYSSAKDALTEALDVDVERMVLREP